MPPKRKPKGNGGYKMAELVEEGTVVVDLHKKEWKVGASVGKGGFGLIYLTQPSSPSNVPSTAAYVMKMEPIENGPLFCEIACFQRAITQKKVSEYMKSKGISTLGVPKFHTMGTYKHHNDNYRFMVMQRLGCDLEAIIAPTGTLSPPTVFNVASQVLDALEYLHLQGYSHADIKAGNLMTGHPATDQMYLIDYGLATRFNIDGKHKAYKEDKKTAHNGTCLFTSSDAHKGACPSARGDLEILGYCMWHWLEGLLPWEARVQEPVYVAREKAIHMKDIESKIGPCIRDAETSKKLCKYMAMVKALEYDQSPDYAALKKVIHTSKPSKSMFSTPTRKASTSKTTTPKATKKSSNLPKSPRSKPIPQILSPKPTLKSTKKATGTRTSRKDMKEERKSPIESRSRSRSSFSPDGGGKRAVGGKGGVIWNKGGVRGNRKANGAGGVVKGNARGDLKASEDVFLNKKVSSPARLTRNDVVSCDVGSMVGVEEAGGQSTLTLASKHLPRLSKKVKVAQTSIAVQTSPGLRGLRKKIKLV